MTLLDARRSSLLLIDFQQRLMPAIDGGEAVLGNAVRLAEAARLLEIRTLRTEQYPKGLGATVPALAGFGDAIEKVTFSACRADAFDIAALPAQLVVAGCETHVCVLQTVLELCEAGKSVFVVADAAGSRTQANWQFGLQRMERGGATIVTTEMVIFEWLGDCTHRHFRTLSQLIK